MNEYKCILSISVANKLIKQGFKVEKIEKGRKHRDRVVFVFRNTKELSEALKQL
ncbi:DUF5659 domain-containing protein [Fervidibacillus halotolerans]|uniref:DUF5659 domain-containing protein n=1 Tax=Fervidibacillus halotolerans TaxID=2980027 RepID=A0A9E8RZQ6_9BACI|nr:DUF5659 domain-containing protein [Fervidibacillus halotolerans]WAA13394.1 DUF5659 domain-containing protein [Fervidibacillus halotolerans]